MISLRLPSNLENRLNQISKYEHLNKSVLIKQALENYFKNYGKDISSYQLGKQFFGKYGSADSSLSVTYKSKLKRKLNEKYSH